MKHWPPTRPDLPCGAFECARTPVPQSGDVFSETRFFRPEKTFISFKIEAKGPSFYVKFGKSSRLT